MKNKEKIIVFLGDSITDSGRTSVKYEDNMGSGYPVLISADLLMNKPDGYRFYNRGINGHRSPDLYARIKRDGINLKPDYISILIGINDVLHGFDQNNGVNVKQYEHLLSMMIEDIKEELPECKILIIEPFTLKGALTNNTDEEPDRWERFKFEVYQRAKAAKKTAEKYNALFVELQKVISDAGRVYGNDYVLRDGVHPTAYGSAIIAQEWLKCFNNQ